MERATNDVLHVLACEEYDTAIVQYKGVVTGILFLKTGLFSLDSHVEATCIDSFEERYAIKPSYKMRDEEALITGGLLLDEPDKKLSLFSGSKWVGFIKMLTFD